MMRIAMDIQGARQLALQLMFNNPWFRVNHPCNECVLLHPVIEPLFASMGQRNSLSTADTPQGKSALLFQQYAKRSAERRALGISAVMVSNTA